MDKHTRPSVSSGTNSELSNRSLLELHLAEYEALMTRNTYLMAIQFTLWPVVGIVLALVAQLWTSGTIKIESRLLIWIAEAGLFLVANNWADTLWEIYNNVTYIEHELRRWVSAELGSSAAFWGYERYLAAQRGLKPALWELALPTAGGGLIVGTAAMATPESTWQILLVAFSVVSEVRLSMRCYDALSLRRHFTDGFLQISSQECETQTIKPWLVATATVVAGILPLTLIAYSTKSLWIGAPIDSPLILVPSVWLGDSVFLPILNWRIVQFLKAFFASQDAANGRGDFIRSLLPAVLASSAISGYTHYIWTQDKYLGFIDTSYGSLSVGGWWHLGFAIVEMGFVFTFVLLWRKVAASGANVDVYRRGTLVWRAFLWYVLLSIADFAVLHLYTLPRRPSTDYSWHTAWEGLLVIPFWFVLRMFIRRLARTAAERTTT